MLFGVFVYRFYLIARFERPASPIKALASDFFTIVSDKNRYVLGIPATIITFAFMYIYVEIKTNIPLFTAFSWDEAFFRIDRAMHFGIDPWRILHPFFRLSDYLVFALNVNYALWFLFVWVIWCVYVFADRPGIVRTRFLLSYFLTWSIGGSLLAVMFASAGPVFYGKLGLSPDPYAPLLEYLQTVNRHVPIWAIELQRTVWDGYVNNGHNMGISAMPSMHNANALLIAIGAFHINRTLGIFMSVHAFLIFIGSIYLGWHYAADAYLAWAVTVASWAISGPLARWWHRHLDNIWSDNRTEVSRR